LSIKRKTLSELVEELQRKDAFNSTRSNIKLIDDLKDEVDELMDAVRERDGKKICGEMGDVLFNVEAIQRRITNQFDVDRMQIEDGVVEKMVARHPHIYGDVESSELSDEWAAWKKAKNIERAMEFLTSRDAGKGRQVALFGSAGDIASDVDIELAKGLGRELARRGLTLVVGGDDGTMGAAATTCRDNGGNVVAILSGSKAVGKPHLFNSIFNTGKEWGASSIDVIRNSLGAIIIGGGSGTEIEFLTGYLKQFPMAFLGNSGLAERFADMPIDERDFQRYSLHFDCTLAVNHVMKEFAKQEGLTHQAIFEVGWGHQLASYPFGKNRNYLDSALALNLAANIAESMGEMSNQMMALSNDGTGDHSYYVELDFFRAASEYAKSSILDPYNGFYQATMIESVGLGLKSIGAYDLAARTIRESARMYKALIGGAEEEERPHLIHSYHGLEATAILCNIRYSLKVNDSGVVELTEALERGLRHMEMAKKSSELWSEAVSSDSYQSLTEEFEELAKEIYGG
jgi:uncharacterized protein (TIGR00725 family)